jgi:hypothetical protein
MIQVTSHHQVVTTELHEFDTETSYGPNFELSSEMMIIAAYDHPAYSVFSL